MKTHRFLSIVGGLLVILGLLTHHELTTGIGVVMYGAGLILNVVDLIARWRNAKKNIR